MNAFHVTDTLLFLYLSHIWHITWGAVLAEYELTEEFVDSLAVDSGQVEIYDSRFNLPGSFGVRVGAGGRKSFFVVLRIRGRRKRMTLGAWPIVDLESARTQAAILAHQVSQGRDPVAEARHYRQLPSFGEFAEKYLAEVAAENCKNNTIREYRRLVKRELAPLWADICIADISPEEITRVLAECALERGKVPLANRIRALLNAIMLYAVELRYIEANPVSQTQRLYESPVPAELMELSKLQAIWEYLGGLRDPHSIALRLVLISGQRLRTVLDMKWSEIQIDAWWPEAAISRPIHLHPVIIALLKNLQEKRKLSDYVFGDSHGRPPRDLRKTCKLMQQELGFDSITPSVIRSSMLAQLSSMGVSSELLAYISGRMTVLRQLAGNKDNETYYAETQKTYARWVKKLSVNTAPKPTSAKIIPLFGE